jgi:hypothetical protein
MFRQPSKWESDSRHLCPQCRHQMRDMGKHFKPPRRADKRLWEVMRFLSDNGCKFYNEKVSARIDRIILGDARQNLKVVRERFSKLKSVTEGERLLRKISVKSKN